ncbi:deaminated glutathione amidase [[Candida] anglica]|uniref:Deaminated glutathione amidase n=1 Tax=[Candida] anglica TaxID=148631 RepID=A0ABP0EJJ4_9ASCO
MSGITSKSLRVACGQLCSSSNLTNNARIIKKLIHKAIAQDVEVLFLPEASDYISRDAKHSMSLANSVHNEFVSIIQNELKALHSSDKKGIYVSIGIHEPSNSKSNTSTDLKKVQNNQIWIDNKGEILHRYQKLHLFDINITNGPILKESNSVEPGNKILDPFVVDDSKNKDFKVGYAICYDIRFPELCLRLRKLGANIITYPSAFTTKTGEVHWQTLGKARAIDSQCFVVMAAQCGEHDVYADLTEEQKSKENELNNGKKRISYGNSVIFDPWGKLLAECKTYSDDLSEDLDSEGDYYELCVADLDLDTVNKVRTDMPLLEHRRPDVFGYEI